MRFVLISLTILTLGAAESANAQSVTPQTDLGPRRSLVWSGTAANAPRPVQEEVQVDVSRPTSVPKLLVIGGLSGFVGLYGGAFAGAVIENEWAPCSCDDPGLRGLLYGALVGPALTIPLSVHLTNHGRGSFAATFGSSLAAGAVGFAIGTTRGDASPFIIAPIAELVTAIIVERALSD
jgi:hypothetical protein